MYIIILYFTRSTKIFIEVRIFGLNRFSKIWKKSIFTKIKYFAAYLTSIQTTFSFIYIIRYAPLCIIKQTIRNWMHRISNNWILSCRRTEIPIQIHSQIPMTWRSIHVHEAHLLIGIIQFWLWCCIAIHLLHSARFRTRKAFQCNNRLQTSRLNC